MEHKDYSKRRLLNALSWIVVGTYIALNAAVVTGGSPLSVLVVILPLINIILITVWFFVRSFYNKVNRSIKHRQYMQEIVVEQPMPKYGKGNGAQYIPNIKIEAELFNNLSADSNNKTTFDTTMKDYLKVGQIITFHDKEDYGMIKRLEVSKVVTHERSIAVSFCEPNASDR